MLRDRSIHIQHVAIQTVAIASAVASLTVATTATGKDGNRGSAQIVTTRRIAGMLTTSIDSLNDSLGIRSIVRSDSGRDPGSKDSRRERKSVEICSFCCSECS